jgi:2'-5' RNA ligase
VVSLALPVDVRTFHPHATLGRCTAPAASGVARWLRRHADLGAPPFRVEAFDLYASELRPDGAVHTLVRRFPLDPG